MQTYNAPQKLHKLQGRGAAMVKRLSLAVKSDKKWYGLSKRLEVVAKFEFRRHTIPH
jgi:hypothetical protein